MSLQLHALPYSRFTTSEALIYCEQTLPLYREAAGTNPLLIGIVDKIQACRLNIFEFTNRNSAYVHTPVARKWDLARTDTIDALISHCESKMRRALAIPDQARAAQTLSELISLKCPEFHHRNDIEQSVNIDALKAELEKVEYSHLAEFAGATDLFSDLYIYNEQYKTAMKDRAEENDQESSNVRRLRNTMMQNISLIHKNIEALMEQNPGALYVIAQKINAYTGETMARVRSRQIHEQKKGTSDAVIVEPEKINS